MKLNRGRVPLTRQLTEALRTSILDGVRRPGDRLPSTRALSQQLRVSRNTVLAAYDQLLAEGYLVARRGASTVVAPGAHRERPPPHTRPRLEVIGSGPLRTDLVDFRSGLPDLTRFPLRAWQHHQRAVWARVTPRDLAYGEPEGRPELRRAIASYLGAHRGVRAHPDQVIITAGTTQAIGIIGRLLLTGPQTRCVLEDPITADIRRILAIGGDRLLPIPVDEAGLRVDLLGTIVGRKPVMVYVTPSHQFPLGVTMPIQRRLELLSYARQARCWVVEDDYDSEYRYDSGPIASLQGLDPDTVLYLGTFSKTLSPSLRIGYLVLPAKLVDLGRRLKWNTDLHNSSVDQLVLARFLESGGYERHVAVTRRVHRDLRHSLVSEMDTVFGDRARVLGSAAGLHLAARFGGVRFGTALLERIRRRGARVYPVEEHAIRKGAWRDTVILGYGMLTPARIREGVAVLAACLPARAPPAPKPLAPCRLNTAYAAGRTGRAATIS